MVNGEWFIILEFSFLSQSDFTGEKYAILEFVARMAGNSENSVGESDVSIIDIHAPKYRL